MRTRVTATAPGWLFLGLLASCGGDPGAPTSGEGTPQASASSPPTSQSPTSQSPTEPKPAGTRLVEEDSHVGTVLFDGTGQAVYVFDVETSSEPRCYGACAEAWPPVLTAGAPRAGAQVDATRLGTTRRRDGSRQVTYAGRPLYFYAHEGKHEVECHDVFLNGGTWYAMQADGRPPA